MENIIKINEVKTFKLDAESLKAHKKFLSSKKFRLRSLREDETYKAIIKVDGNVYISSFNDTQNIDIYKFTKYIDKECMEAMDIYIPDEKYKSNKIVELHKIVGGKIESIKKYDKQMLISDSNLYYDGDKLVRMTIWQPNIRTEFRYRYTSDGNKVYRYVDGVKMNEYHDAVIDAKGNFKYDFMVDFDKERAISKKLDDGKNYLHIFIDKK